MHKYRDNLAEALKVLEIPDKASIIEIVKMTKIFVMKRHARFMKRIK